MKFNRTLVTAFALAAMTVPSVAQEIKPEWCRLFEGSGSNAEQQRAEEAAFAAHYEVPEGRAEMTAIESGFMAGFWNSVDTHVAAARPATVGDYIDLVQTAYRDAFNAHAGTMAEHNVTSLLKIGRWDQEWRIPHDEIMQQPLRDNAHVVELLGNGVGPGLKINIELEQKQPGATYWGGATIATGMGSALALSMDSPVENLLGKGNEIMYSAPGAGPQVLSFIC